MLGRQNSIQKLKRPEVVTRAVFFETAQSMPNLFYTVTKGLQMLEAGTESPHMINFPCSLESDTDIRVTKLLTA